MRCCFRCKSPYGCARTVCACHQTRIVYDLVPPAPTGDVFDQTRLEIALLPTFIDGVNQ